MISGRIAIETLLTDLRSICKNATSPNIALCARTETAHFIKEFYSQDETKLAVSHYEISFFEETNAIDFIKEKISEKRTLTPAAEEWIKAQFSEIKRILGNDQATDLDITKFENAVKTILKHFRKHGKDAPGRHFEFIKNIIIGGSNLKQSIHDFFISRNIIYQDSKDPRQYKLDISKLEVFGINWGHISQNSTPEFKQLFDEYSLWKSSKK